MRHPWLTVTIPVYNAEPYLPKCLETILQQTFHDFEVILINDGSTDGSLRIAEHYAALDDRIRIINKENAGSLKARFDAAKSARGEYVLFTDADDYFSSNRAFEFLYSVAGNSQYELIQFNYHKKFNHIRIKGKRSHKRAEVQADEFNQVDYPKFLCTYYAPSRLDSYVWDKLYHCRLLKNIPHLPEQESIFYLDDVFLNLYLLRDCQSMLSLDIPLYVYRANVGFSHTRTERHMFDINAVSCHQMKMLEQWEGSGQDTIRRTMLNILADEVFIFAKSYTSQYGAACTEQAMQAFLPLPAYVQADNYFRENGAHAHLPAELLRRGDARAYVQAAQEALRSCSLRSRLMQSIIRLLKRI